MHEREQDGGWCLRAISEYRSGEGDVDLKEKGKMGGNGKRGEEGSRQSRCGEYIEQLASRGGNISLVVARGMTQGCACG